MCEPYKTAIKSIILLFGTSWAHPTQDSVLQDFSVNSIGCVFIKAHYSLIDKNQCLIRPYGVS